MQRNAIKPCNEERADAPRHWPRNVEGLDGERQDKSCDLLGQIKSRFGALDQRRQRRDRRAGAKGDELRWERGPREAAHRSPHGECDDNVEQQRNREAKNLVRQDVETNRSSYGSAGVRSHWQQQRKYADRRY